jgi:segregation and condensation protein A
MDLLLHLIEKAEVDIKDIFVSEITAQYLEYMDCLDELDMDTASEFIGMAATLVYIKSRTLLPRAPVEEAPEEDPEEVLIRQLREYKIFKEAGEQLGALLEYSRKIYTKLPEEFLSAPKEIRWTGVSKDDLYRALCEILFREEPYRPVNPLHEVSADLYTVRSQLHMIREMLKERKSVRFTELFLGQYDKIKYIVTFMALLEMMAHNEIKLDQSVPFGTITISANELMDDDESVEYMDESV